MPIYYKDPSSQQTYLRVYRGQFTRKIGLLERLQKKEDNISSSETVICTYSYPKYYPKKVIVFDLDETLGSFSDLYILWCYLENIKKEYSLNLGLDQSFFNELLNLYPEFLRLGITTILEYLVYKKKSNECSGIFIYTNNSCPPYWVSFISGYIDYKLNTTGFIDKIIRAFKVDDVIIEPLRTTRDKTHSDFIRCSLLPRNTEICFIDDVQYMKMQCEKIYYIQPKIYRHNLCFCMVVERFLSSPLFTKFVLSGSLSPFQSNQSTKILHFLKEQCINPDCNHSCKTIHEMEVDMLVSQKLLYHIKEFFFITTRKSKTKKRVYRVGKFTRKK
jgi:hypothetical protein